MIEGAILDMDGTLLDSMPTWRNLGSDYLKSLGLEIDRDEIEPKFRKMTLREAGNYMAERFDLKKTGQQIEDEINIGLKNKYRYEHQLKTGAKDFLFWLKDRGVKMCVATSTAESEAKAAFERLGVYDLFEGIYSSYTIGRAKTTPDLYRMALAGLGTAKEKTMVFEDVIFALKVARDDGFLTCGVYDDNEKDQDSIIALSDVYIKDFSDLKSYKYKIEAL